MERFWRSAGVMLGKYWLVVLGAVVVLSAVLIPGLSRLEFATGQDSYLNSDSQIATDNEFFQGRFGGEVVVLLFRPSADQDVSGLIDGANGEELQRIEEEIRAIRDDLVFSAITPWTSVQFSDNVIQLLRENNTMTAAVKTHQKESGLSLSEAKQQVEEVMERDGITLGGGQ